MTGYDLSTGVGTVNAALFVPELVLAVALDRSSSAVFARLSGPDIIGPRRALAGGYAPEPVPLVAVLRLREEGIANPLTHVRIEDHIRADAREHFGGLEHRLLASRGERSLAKCVRVRADAVVGDGELRMQRRRRIGDVTHVGRAGALPRDRRDPPRVRRRRDARSRARRGRRWNGGRDRSRVRRAASSHPVACAAASKIARKRVFIVRRYSPSRARVRYSPRVSSGMMFGAVPPSMTKPCTRASSRNC